MGSYSHLGGRLKAPVNSHLTSDCSVHGTLEKWKNLACLLKHIWQLGVPPHRSACTGEDVQRGRWLAHELESQQISVSIAATFKGRVGWKLSRDSRAMSAMARRNSVFPTSCWSL